MINILVSIYLFISNKKFNYYYCLKLNRESLRCVYCTAYDYTLLSEPITSDSFSFFYILSDKLNSFMIHQAFLPSTLLLTEQNCCERCQGKGKFAFFLISSRLINGEGITSVFVSGYLANSCIFILMAHS